MKERVNILFAAAVAALIVIVAGFVMDPRTTLAAYLATWLAFVSISIGALGMLHMTYLVRRPWTEELHPALISATDLLPIWGALFIPVLLGAALIYPAAGNESGLPPFKAVYLAPWFVALRTIIYFAIWSLLAIKTRAAWGDARRMTRIASIGLIVLSLTVSLAGVDWLESLNPGFHSSIYGLLFLNDVLLAGLAFPVAVGLLSRDWIRSTRGYGGLLLGAFLLWAYLHAMQYIVIWSANIPEEVKWYLIRTAGPWGYVVTVLAFAQFLIPFFILLSDRGRRDRRILLGISATTLLMRWVEMVVLALPEIPHLNPAVLAIALVATASFFAAFLGALFARRFRHDVIAAKPVRAET
ncbi:hypothetical protein ACSVBT_15370 [Afipia sp. TerB]